MLLVRNPSSRPLLPRRRPRAIACAADFRGTARLLCQNLPLGVTLGGATRDLRHALPPVMSAVAGQLGLRAGIRLRAPLPRDNSTSAPAHRPRAYVYAERSPSEAALPIFILISHARARKGHSAAGCFRVFARSARPPSTPLPNAKEAAWWGDLPLHVFNSLGADALDDFLPEDCGEFAQLSNKVGELGGR